MTDDRRQAEDLAKALADIDRCDIPEGSGLVALAAEVRRLEAMALYLARALEDFQKYTTTSHGGFHAEFNRLLSSPSVAALLSKAAKSPEAA